MTETKILNGLIKVKQYHGPSMGDVFLSWFFYGLFRMAFYRFLLPWSFFGIALNYILLFSAISLTFRAAFSPRRYIYSVQTETEPEEPSETHSIPHDSPKTPSQKQQEPEIKEHPREDEVNNTPQHKSVESEPQTHNVMYCSSCGVENSSQARYCAACGSKLQ
ncbi:MAG: zinc-ribbon domain-containing protein [Promethearchaeota archaeon]